MFAEMVDAFLLTPRIDTNSRSAPVTLQNTPTLASADRAFVVRHGSTELSDANSGHYCTHNVTVESEELERRFPDKPTHAEQACRTTRPSLIAPKEDLL